MNRRLLSGVGLLSALLMAIGLLGVDRPLALWLRTSGFENARMFTDGLQVLDALTGLHLWVWLAAIVVTPLGLAGMMLWRRARWPRALIAAGVVQALCIATMILGKNAFGRLRPREILESGDWSTLWFAGGGSFPSGHSAFYFGLFLPLAAACPLRGLRVLLLAIPVYVVIARLDLAAHFLSDVMASALMAAIYSLLVATLAQRWLPASASGGQRRLFRSRSGL